MTGAYRVKAPGRKPGAGDEERAPVNIRITDEAMTSDTTPHRARTDGDGWAGPGCRAGTDPQPGHHGHGAGRDGRSGIGDHTGKRWLFIEGWADELGITGADAVAKINQHRG